MRMWMVLALAVPLTACYASQHLRDGGGETDGGHPDACCEDDADAPVVVPPRSDKVDLLFVVDNSNSMEEEQVVLAGQVELMVRALVDPEPDPVTGVAPPAVEDLHVGVVTTDMGTGGYTIMTCTNPISGDNGVLQSAGRLPGCASDYVASDCALATCPWLSHSETLPDVGDDPANPPLWDDFACIATLGTGGCGFEQPLEASLRALTVQTEPGRPNEGFVRPDSVLAVVYLTDEDDCSSANAEVFDPTREDLGTLNLRCALRPDLLHPVSRYRDGLLGLRPGREQLLVVGAIVGVPVDGSWEVGESLDDLRELQQVNPTNPTELVPSCNTEMGRAFPPVRIAELAYMLGDNGVLGSICRSDFTSVIRPLVARIRGLIAP